MVFLGKHGKGDNHDLSKMQERKRADPNSNRITQDRMYDNIIVHIPCMYDFRYFHTDSAIAQTKNGYSYLCRMPRLRS